MVRILRSKAGVRIAPQAWMTEAPTRRVLKALATDGGTARFVGGSVRDTLLGRPVSDIDIATSASPEVVTALLQKARVKVVPTGIAHGTVTAVAKPRHFEITTLRRDVEPQGRRAIVAFVDDWRVDAERRDFTMNALFLDPDGTLHDYVDGLADVAARRVRFVGDPERRIREDVLRLLRFYRFHAQLGRPPADEAARAACRALAHLLPTLSAERVAAELLKLLAARDPLPALALMKEDAVLPVILPEATRFDRLAGMIVLEPEIDALRRLAALVTVDAEGAHALARRLRLSNDQRSRLLAMASPEWTLALADDARAQRRALYHLGPQRYRDLVLLHAADAGALAKRRARTLLARADKTGALEFPLKGRDVTALRIKPGPRVGELLKRLTEWWEAGDFRAGRGACLAELKKRAKSA
ncbi:MAG TPA: CCA tRNA nucleotidyltransferase [Stellaceae bacterium]|nr:CCA tRNA nucleotidyltransferase [Stellaceae bacterium]